MKDKLKSYRQIHHLSKKEMAKKLDIDEKEYKRIEKGGKMEDKLKIKIKKILKDKSKKKGAQVTLPKGIEQITKSIDHINSITANPMQKTIDRINSSWGQRSFLQNITNLNKVPKTTVDSSLVFGNMAKLYFNSLNHTSKLSNSLKQSISSQYEAYWGMQAVLSKHSKNIDSVNLIGKGLVETMLKSTSTAKISPPKAFKYLRETITKNRTAYEDYTVFSSKLVGTVSNSLISSTIYSNLVTANNLVNMDKRPSELDILSGNTFALFSNPNNFNEEKEILEQIESDPELKKQADDFFDEVHQIINIESPEKINEKRLEKVFINFTIWISETFHKSKFDSKRISKVIFKSLPVISIFLSIYLYQISSQRILQIQEMLRKNQSMVLKQNTQIDTKLDKTLELNEGILDFLNSHYSENMVAKQDVYLRTRRGSKSKILGIVLATQKVIVLDKKVKWIEIIYVDIKENKAKTGWVRSEFFK